MSDKKPPGRPRKALLDRKVSPVTVRFLPAEAQQIDLLAREAGKTTSEYVRAALSSRPAPSIAPELKHDLYRLLLAVRNGLRDGSPPRVLVERMQAVIDRLDQ